MPISKFRGVPVRETCSEQDKEKTNSKRDGRAPIFEREQIEIMERAEQRQMRLDAENREAYLQMMEETEETQAQFSPMDWPDLEEEYDSDFEERVKTRRNNTTYIVCRPAFPFEAEEQTSDDDLPEHDPQQAPYNADPRTMTKRGFEAISTRIEAQGGGDSMEEEFLETWTPRKRMKLDAQNDAQSESEMDGDTDAGDTNAGDTDAGDTDAGDANAGDTDAEGAEAEGAEAEGAEAEDARAGETKLEEVD